ncbi:MAG: tripartite tricarboxylate transporter substrate binding protein [Comamonas sp.]|jgi:tripartite-type tricarboxylate transporter receptor subunit TctC|uniref:Bug family tripartite tricarboxylate transporter substrate binding protein n=1 Tax=Comamonas sp. TaxID=34028 RepID=UPI002820C30E|nr:tripartite tricarboxylate transporter substrate binding protein [Comamonas sp.]MDR2326788.1 tripartite tricarboxylate transporter substrate binding protein [Acidovorax sp.]MDR3064540.1 tripartite tricarboxylate transporter substrate binding protein [Comamonas sp.]
MSISRRSVMHTTALLAALAAIGSAQAADNWPSRPIRFIVPFSAGGANDLLARSAAEGASRVLGQPIVVENRPGGGGTVGADLVAKSQPDGYTWLISAAGVISNSQIKKRMPFKDTDLLPVVMIGLAPSVIVVPKTAPYQNLRDFVEASKQGEGFNFATAGTGSTPHFVAEMLNVKYGAKLQPVPYKSGSESTTAVLGGQVEGTSEASIIALPHILKDGKFKPLATTWTQRISAYPSLSTAVEQGFADLQIAHWAGLHAPKGTSPATMDKLAAAVDKAMREPATVEKLKALGIEPVGGTRADFIKFTDAERQRLGEIVKAAKMQEQ